MCFPGDVVYSTNTQTGEQDLKQVTQVFVNETDQLIHVSIPGSEIKATPSHPFWVVGKGWSQAAELRAGDNLLLDSGETAVITGIECELLQTPIKVYNLEVEDWHTYYVSQDGILVHNACWRGVGGAGGPTNEFVNLASPNRTNHILYGDKTGGGHLWPGAPGKSAFPSTWSADYTMHNISDIATDPNLKWNKGRTVQGVQRFEVTGERDSIPIKVITDGTDIITAYPIK